MLDLKLQSIVFDVLCILRGIIPVTVVLAEHIPISLAARQE